MTNDGAQHPPGHETPHRELAKVGRAVADNTKQRNVLSSSQLAVCLICIREMCLLLNEVVQKRTKHILAAFPDQQCHLGDLAGSSR